MKQGVATTPCAVRSFPTLAFVAVSSQEIEKVMLLNFAEERQQSLQKPERLE
jgi:hypothetical protein